MHIVDQYAKIEDTRRHHKENRFIPVGKVAELICQLLKCFLVEVGVVAILASSALSSRRFSEVGVAADSMLATAAVRLSAAATGDMSMVADVLMLELPGVLAAVLAAAPTPAAAYGICENQPVPH